MLPEALLWSRKNAYYRKPVIYVGMGMSATSVCCGPCAFEGVFIAKKGMRFLTIFFLIPVVP